MANILHIETTTATCSVAVSQDGLCVFNREDHQGPNHAVVLGVFVDEALAYADSTGLLLDAVAVSCGPGSYTGLRIGVSMAKGICYARQIKLIAVPTLELLCVPVLLNDGAIDDQTLLCPMLDARRMEVYSAIYNRSLQPQRSILADVVETDTYEAWLNRQPMLFFGNGADKCKPVITHKNAHFIDNIQPLAKNMLPLADRRFFNQQFEDVAYFEPFYLKNFVAKTAKKLI